MPMKTHLLTISLLAGSLGIATWASALQPGDASPPPPRGGPDNAEPREGPGNGPGRRGMQGERQGDRPGGGPRQIGREGREGRDPAMIKGAVDRMLERSIQFTERLQAIKKKLDSGVPVMEIREDFDQAIRSLGEGMNQMGLGPRGGMGGPGGMRGGEGPDDRPDGPGVGGGDGAGGPPLAPLGGRNAGRGAGGPGGAGGPPQKLTAEERTRIENAMKTQAPTAFAELEAVRAKNPHAAERMFERLGPRLRLVVEHKEKAGSDYESKKADLESFVEAMRAGRLLAEERSGANKPEVIEQLRGQLRAAIGKQVDIRLRMQEEQLGELTHRAQKLREEIERNRANKDKFVEDRVSETMDAGKRDGPKK